MTRVSLALPRAPRWSVALILPLTLGAWRGAVDRAYADAGHPASPAATTAPDGAPDGAPAIASTLCGTPVRLDGATAEPDSARVVFDPAWRPHLSELAACMARPEHAESCVYVRGQYDDHRFSPAVRTALGSERAAQVHRARARGDSVMGELLALGVEAERIVAIPPPDLPTYRGVELTVVTRCARTREVVRTVEVTSPPVVVRDVHSSVTVATGEQGDATSAKEPAQPERSVSLEGQVVGGLMAVSPEDVWYLSVRPRVGWQGRYPYVHAFGGFAVAQREEHRVGFEWGLAAGVRPVRWLQVGLVAAQRRSSTRALRAWLEQTWSLGIEVSERVWQQGHGSLWLTQSAWPVSYRQRRATLVSGELIDTADVRDYAPRLELGVVLRTMLF